MVQALLEPLPCGMACQIACTRRHFHEQDWDSRHSCQGHLLRCTEWHALHTVHRWIKVLLQPWPLEAGSSSACCLLLHILLMAPVHSVVHKSCLHIK